jgi:hypothetical protein
VKQKGCNGKEILSALNPPEGEDVPRENPTSLAFLFFVVPTFKRLSRVLSKFNIKILGVLPKKLAIFLLSVQDIFVVKTLPLYSIPCQCWKVYTGQTGRFIVTKIKNIIDISGEISLG